MHSRYPTPRSAALLLALVLSTSTSAQPRYDILELEPLGFQLPRALNNHGHVVGETPDDILLWDGNSATLIDVPVSLPHITGFADSGAIVGYFLDPIPLTDAGFAIEDGTFKELENLPRSSRPVAVNSPGQILIESGGVNQRSSIYQAGSRTELGSTGGPKAYPAAINTAGWVVGRSAATMNLVPSHAFLYRDATMTDLGTLGGDHSEATDINDAGNIVGIANDAAGLHSAMLYSAGRLLRIEPTNTAAPTSATKINNYNVVAGLFPEPAIWSGGVLKRLRDLADFEGLDLTPSQVLDFNDRGQLLVRAFYGDAHIAGTTVLLTPRQLPPTRLTALAARALAGTDNQTSIAGFVVAGKSNGSILLRTVGPGLAPLGVTNAGTDPALKIFDSSNTAIATNDNWSANSGDAETLAATAASVGAQPLTAGSTDAALLADLPPGAYTAHASNAVDPSRIVLTEIYDAGDEDAARLTAASIRLQVGTGESIGIVGFALAGDAPAKVLLRVLGPELATRGVTNTLSDPQLFLYRGSTPVMGNDDWGSASTTPLLAATTTQVGLPTLPDASKDAALLIQLEPGAYSVHVSGANNTTGIALVEVYLVP